MDAALEIHDYLPLAYPSAGEGEYIRFVWEAFESNYVAGKYQFAILALGYERMNAIPAMQIGQEDLAAVPERVNESLTGGLLLFTNDAIDPNEPRGHPDKSDVRGGQKRNKEGE